MIKKWLAAIMMCVFLASASGCIALLAGAAAGAGTAVWLSGKLTQEFSAPQERVVNSAERALKAMKLKILKETTEEDVTQLKSEYTDGKDIWIDIKKIAERSTKVEVRVGGVSPDKDIAAKIMKRIERGL